MRKVCWTLGCSSSARGRNVGLPSSGSAGVLSIALTLGRQRRDGRDDARRHDVLSLQQSESRSRARGHADHVFAEDELDRRVHARRLDDVAPAAPKGELRVLRVILGAGLRRVARRGALGPKVPWRSAGREGGGAQASPIGSCRTVKSLGRLRNARSNMVDVERGCDQRTMQRPGGASAGSTAKRGLVRGRADAVRRARTVRCGAHGGRCEGSESLDRKRPRDVLERPRRNGAGALVLASEGLCEASRQRMREQENRERGWTAT